MIGLGEQAAYTPEWRSGVPSRCPACGVNSLFRRFETVRQQGGALVDIFMCSSCAVLLNLGAYASLEAHADPKQSQKTDYYLSPSSSAADESAKVDKSRSLIEYLTSKLARDWKNLTFCDLGAGRGYTALAAASIFRRSIACDFDLRNISQVCAVIGTPHNLNVHEAITDIQQNIDVLYAWHVLEHIPNLLDFMHALRPKLNEDCTIFLQCPCYRPNYIVDCHYLFFSEISLREVMKRAGFQEIEIGFDVDNGFISYFGTLK